MDRRVLRRAVVLALCAAWAIPSFAGTPRPTETIRGDARPAVAVAPPSSVRFEPNVGQVRDETAFIVRGSGFTAYLTPTGIVTRYRARAGILTQSKLANPNGRRETRDVAIRMRFEGADPTPSFETGNRLPGVSNYFVGSDPERWRTNVPAFDSVRRRGLYPGTDLVLYRAGGLLEYDLVLEPGADPDAISFVLEGAEHVDVDATGALALRTEGGELRHEPPVAYQDVSGQRRKVPTRYTVRPGGRIGFDVASFDPSRPLVIDPVLSFSTYLGGFGDDDSKAVAVDAVGNVYVTGDSIAPDYPTRNPLQPGLASTDGTDVVVTKLDPSGSTLVYSTYLGGTFFDFGNAIAIDTAGAVYVAGSTGSADFPTVNPFQLDTDGEGINFFDVFVAKIDPSGSALVYSTYLGGESDESGTGIAVNVNGEAFVSGFTRSEDFPLVNSLQTFQFLDDGFVTKFAASGSTVLYSSLFGGVNEDVAAAIAIDGAGNAYATGTTFSAETFPVVSAFQPEQGSLSDFDGFVIKLGPQGNTLLISSFIGGAFRDEGFGIAVDSSGAIYVTGYTQSENFPTQNPIQPGFGGFFDTFVAKVNPSGQTLAYSTYLGGDLQDYPNRIAVDAAGNAILVGLTASTNFPTFLPMQTDPGDNDFDGYIVKLNPAGSAFVYSTYFGGDSGDNLFGLALDGYGGVYIVGETFSDDFPVKDPFQATSSDALQALTGIVARIADPVPNDTIGVYDAVSGAWFLRNDNSPGPANLTFVYGPSGAGLVPITGDWNGDGMDSPGLYDPATGAFFLRNSSSPGPADMVFTFGAGGSGLQPLAGDWDGNGTDTIGLYNPATAAFFLRNSNTPGGADSVFTFGAPAQGYTALAGDWNGDRIDTVGLYAPATGTFFLKTRNSSGGADFTFVFGGGGNAARIGDWDGDGRGSIGLFVPASQVWFLRDANSGGSADHVFGFGPPSASLTPLAGDWDGM